MTGGDAETGFGLEVGGRVSVRGPDPGPDRRGDGAGPLGA